MIEGLKIFPMDRYEDERGTISQLYHYEVTHRKTWYWHDWKEDKVVWGKKNSLRGLHGDYKTAKLISRLYGDIYLAVVDCRPQSPTFGEVWQDYIGNNQVYVPAGCANGHYCCEDSIFFYKWSAPYELDNQFTIDYNDKDLGIKWPYVSYPITISERDKQGKSWKLFAEEKSRETH